MSAKYILERICGNGCPCRINNYTTHLNLVRTIPLVEGIDPPAHLPETKCINVRGRSEHEAILKDSAWCQELGLDQMYETLIYLKRWGGWLSEE